MKNLLIAAVLFVFAVSCNNAEKSPDVSGIPVEIKIERFDKFLFTDIDTNNIARGISIMQSEYPHFAPDFLVNILGLPLVNPPASDSAAAITFPELRRFITLTRPLYDSVAPLFKDMSEQEKELKKAFQHVKYYFPSYPVPKVVAYLGPFNAPGIAITPGALAIGLQLYAGKNFSFYSSPEGQELFPLYISRRFEPEYITVNSMKAVTEDIYPDNSADQPLILQMIEKGKHWWLVKQFLPGANDSLITGYTGQQLKWCESNEGEIWNFIQQAADLYTTDLAITKNYVGDAPSTQGMPEVSPGNIGQWVGLKIVEEYLDKHPVANPAELLKTDARKIFSESKYKPK